MNQETLEEAKERYLDSPTPHSYRLAVEFGAKWQQEQMEKLKDFEVWKEWKNTGIIKSE